MITDITYNDHTKQQKAIQTSELEKLFHYYNNNAYEIKRCLEKALAITFLAEDITDFQKFWINIVPKAIDQLSIVYRDPATRQLILPDEVKPIQVEGEENKLSNAEILTEYYNELLHAVSMADNQALRYAKLANVSITAIRFDKGKIKYKVLPTWLYDIKVAEDDPYKMEGISYATYFDNKKYHVVWTESEYYMVEELEWGNIKFVSDAVPVDKRLKVGSNKDMRNPYGIIPYAILRLKEQGDFLGNGQTDLVEGNEQINIIMTELMNEHILMGVGTVLATNCNLATKKVANDTTDPKRVRIGRKYPISQENVKSDDGSLPPSLEYVSTDPQLMDLRETIDWSVKMFAMSKGLNPNSFLAEVQAISGFSKLVDAMEQMELRKDDVEPCRLYEDERFEKTRVINNYHKETTDGSKYKLMDIPDNCYLQVDFAEIQQQRTPDEQQKNDDWNLKHNLINVYDIARRQNPDLTDDELKVNIDKNKVINDLYKPEPIIFNNQNTAGAQ